MKMNVRIASAAYAVAPDDEAVEVVFERERTRIEAALSPLSPESRRKAIDGLGLKRVRVCDEKKIYELIHEAASKAIAEAGITARDINLILDYSTWSSESSQGLSFAHQLSSDLGAENSMILSFKVGGCAGLHVAIKTALGWMSADESIHTVLLVAGDAAPAGNRSLLPITIHGDASSAVILRREDSQSPLNQGPLLLSVEAMTVSNLQKAITMVRKNGHADIVVDALCIEQEVMPVYFLNMFLVMNKALAAASLTLNDIDHFIYSNISRRDREGFCKMLRLPKGSLPPTPMAEYGHTFASDLLINYVDMRRDGLIRPGQLLLFASAGIGFTWGVTIARA
jgi:3-oxoacyl-[acyl-carrier-protein] synthase III